MKKTIFALLMVLFANCLQAQSIAGAWYGALQIQGVQLRIVFHISKTGDGYETTMDSPDQHAMGLATDKTTVTGNEVTIVAGKLGLKYTGAYMPDSGKINGVLAQGGHSLPLALTTTATKVSIAKPAARPQDPKDFPYKQEEVSFTNAKAGATLAGTLTMPEHGKASKIVVLITGSGPQNRNEEIENHRPFLVWSDWLTRNGVAVLRYDDRGTGESTGIFGAATTADFAGDVDAAISYIQSRADLKNLSIGLMGHSEGGMIAPVVASRNSAVKFIILLAGPGVPIARLMADQTADQMRLANAPDSAIALSAGLNKKVYAVMNDNKDIPVAELRAKLTVIVHDELGKFPAEALDGKSVDEMTKTSVALYTAPWYRYFITFDPAVYLTRTHCPVLAMNGTMDMQVRCEPNLKAIQECLRKAGNKKVQITPLQGLNHLFQKAATGSVSEYGEIAETINPAALKTVTDWINTL